MNTVLEEANERVKAPMRKALNMLVRPRVGPRRRAPAAAHTPLCLLDCDLLRCALRLTGAHPRPAPSSCTGRTHPPLTHSPLQPRPPPRRSGRPR